ncbi:uncharacterized protein LOC131334497 [Rhododendron vialii]|uniref:uncharacterized protein LOC131334497 n=1 Tax=Rhododendron vialii TaxID=182163 RepID=UPI00265DA183|nr:uncharacterized protein LOC131334497 [Rhododendron vialii]
MTCKWTISLFWHVSISGSFILLCLIEMVGNLCLLGLVQMRTAKICILLWEFETRLEQAFEVLGLEQMMIRMANRSWTIPIENLYLNVEAFNQFVDASSLQFLDYLMVPVLPTVIFRDTWRHLAILRDSR